MTRTSCRRPDIPWRYSMVCLTYRTFIYFCLSALNSQEKIYPIRHDWYLSQSDPWIGKFRLSQLIAKTRSIALQYNYVIISLYLDIVAFLDRFEIFRLLFRGYIMPRYLKQCDVLLYLEIRLVF